MAEARKPMMIRMDRHERAVLKRLAEKAGVSASEYIRRLVKRSAAQKGGA